MDFNDLTGLEPAEQQARDFIHNLRATKGEAFARFVQHVTRTGAAYNLVLTALDRHAADFKAAHFALRELYVDSVQHFAEHQHFTAATIEEGMQMSAALMKITYEAVHNPPIQ